MADHSAIAQILRELEFSSGLSDEEIVQLANIGQLEQFSAGEVVFSEGSRVNQLYLVSTGRIELRMSVSARGALPILTLSPGDLLGWSDLLTEGEMTATAVAVKDTELVRIDARQLKDLCDRDHDIGYEMMRRVALALSTRLVATRLQVLDLFAAPPEPVPGPTGDGA